MLSSVNPVHAAIINIPADQQTIQAGVDAAEAGDTVLVAPGVYREFVWIRRNVVTLASLIFTTGDPAYIDSTIIDGEEERACLKVSASGDGTSFVRGFTIRNGGGVSHGAGISTGRATFEDMVVTNCTCGAVYTWAEDSVSFTRCKITRNGWIEGGNTQGGGMYTQGRVFLEDCVIADNRALDGGGIFVTRLNGGELHAKHVLISGNIAMDEGRGGGIYLRNSLAVLDQVTLTGNRTPNGDDAAIYGGGECSLTLMNSLGFNNGTPSIRVMDRNARLEVDFSDIEGGINGIVEGGEADINYGDNNIDADPLFVDPDNGDYHLTENSPCIDAGDPDSPLDPDGTRADMGAFYFPQVHPPVLDHPIPDITVAEDCGAVMIADLDTVFSDVDGDSLWYAVIGAEELHLALNEDNLLWFEPALNFNGDSLAVEVRAYSGNDSTTAEFLVSVTPVNDVPGHFNLLSPNRHELDWFNEWDTIRFEWEASVDPDHETVRYLLRLDFHYGPHIDSVAFDADTLTVCCPSDTIDLAPWQPGGQIINVIQKVSWWVVAISGADSVRSDSIFTFWLGTGVEKDRENNEPSAFNLHSLSPNPFNSSTTIRFGLSKLATTRIGIYGLNGRIVQELWTGRDAYPPGEHAVVWNAEGLPGGVYLVRLESGGEVKTTKAILLR